MLDKRSQAHLLRHERLVVPLFDLFNGKNLSTVDLRLVFLVEVVLFCRLFASLSQRSKGHILSLFCNNVAARLANGPVDELSHGHVEVILARVVNKCRIKPEELLRHVDFLLVAKIYFDLQLPICKLLLKVISCLTEVGCDRLDSLCIGEGALDDVSGHVEPVKEFLG